MMLPRLEDMLALFRQRTAQQELVYVSWLEDDGTRQDDWADAAVVDDTTLKLTEAKSHRYVPAHEVKAELVTPTADLSQVVTLTGAVHSSGTRDSVFRVDGFGVDAVSDYQPAVTAPVFQKPETYLLDTPQAFSEIRRWLGCTQVYFRENEAYDAEAGEYRLKFWEIAEEIPAGPGKSAAFPYYLTVLCVEEAVIRYAPGYVGYFFGPHLSYNQRKRRVSFGQNGIASLVRGPDCSVDLTVGRLAVSVLRTGVPSWAWEPDDDEGASTDRRGR